jgi:hypothetical protein
MACVHLALLLLLLRRLPWLMFRAICMLLDLGEQAFALGLQAQL